MLGFRILIHHDSRYVPLEPKVGFVFTYSNNRIIMSNILDFKEPTIFAILLGKHSYSISPENETAWCRVCLVYGLLLGALFSILTMLVLTN